jgi:hypothetical protein
VVIIIDDYKKKLNLCLLTNSFLENPFAAAINGFSMEEDQDSIRISRELRKARVKEREKGVAVRMFAPG